VTPGRFTFLALEREDDPFAARVRFIKP